MSRHLGVDGAELGVVERVRIAVDFGHQIGFQVEGRIVDEGGVDAVYIR